MFSFFDFLECSDFRKLWSCFSMVKRKTKISDIFPKISWKRKTYIIFLCVHKKISILSQAPRKFSVFDQWHFFHSQKFKTYFYDPLIFFAIRLFFLILFTSYFYLVFVWRPKSRIILFVLMLIFLFDYKSFYLFEIHTVKMSQIR